MMHSQKMKRPFSFFGVFLTSLLFLFINLTVKFTGTDYEKLNKELKQQAIEKGFAKYNSKTGEWEWDDNTETETE